MTMVAEFYKDLNAVPLRPQLNFYQLGRTRDVANRIPRFPLAEEMNSFAMKSMLGSMRREAQTQSQAVSTREGQQAQMKNMASQS